MGQHLKILYAVQATGNGHIARAEILLPYLQQFGNVDVFLSGSNSNLPNTLPVKFVSKGLSLFYGKNGGLAYKKIWKELNIIRLYKEAKQLPVCTYDLVINDFECITALACLLQKKKSIAFGHQASFLSKNCPRPCFKNLIGELILKFYAKSSVSIGLHFKAYDSFIFNPIIKEEIVQAIPVNKGHITVYTSHYNEAVILPELHKISPTIFHFFNKNTTTAYWVKNVLVQPINNKAFTESLITCKGVITGAGFETPAEALYLGKQLLCLPINGQYEQQCNAAALAKDFNVKIVNKIDKNFAPIIKSWLQVNTCKKLTLQHATHEIVKQVIEKGLELEVANSNNIFVLQNNATPNMQVAGL
jgi:uncharacterized protein (TIGR00661 family)